MQEQRLRRLQADRRALEAEVVGVVRAQQMQIKLLDRQAAQIAHASTAEQRLSSSFITNSKQARLARAKQEHATLLTSLESECERTTILEEKLTAAKHTLYEGRRTAEVEMRAIVMASRRRAPAYAQLQRTQQTADDATVASAALRCEIDTLRSDKLMFVSKIEGLEQETRRLASERARLLDELRKSTEARQLSDQKASRLESAGNQHARYRQARRRQVEGQLSVIERKAKLVQSKRGMELMAQANLATSSSTALRLSYAASVKERLAGGGLTEAASRQPMPLGEVVAALAELTGTDDDIEVATASLAEMGKANALQLERLSAMSAQTKAEEEACERLRKHIKQLQTFPAAADTTEQIGEREKLDSLRRQHQVLPQEEGAMHCSQPCSHCHPLQLPATCHHTPHTPHTTHARIRILTM